MWNQTRKTYSAEKVQMFCHDPLAPQTRSEGNQVGLKPHKIPKGNDHGFAKHSHRFKAERKNPTGGTY